MGKAYAINQEKSILASTDVSRLIAAFGKTRGDHLILKPHRFEPNKRFQVGDDSTILCFREVVDEIPNQHMRWSNNVTNPKVANEPISEILRVCQPEVCSPQLKDDNFGAKNFQKTNQQGEKHAKTFQMLHSKIRNEHEKKIGTLQMLKHAKGQISDKNSAVQTSKWPRTLF